MMSDLPPNWEQVPLSSNNAYAKLRPVFGKQQVIMFEPAGIVDKHLG